MVNGADDERDSGSMGSPGLTAALAPEAREMYRRLMQSDYPGALELARNALVEDPEDQVARVIVAHCDHEATVPSPRPDDTAEVMVAGGEPGQSDPPDANREMVRCFLQSQYPRALALAELVLCDTPDDPLASAIALECRTLLERGSSIPVRTAMLDDRIDPDDRHGIALLRLVDGSSSVQEIAEASELAPREAIRLIEEFVELGVLRLDPPLPLDD
jgi:hypothetical protein